MFREGEGKEKERERNITVWLPLIRPLLGTWPETQACALTENRTGNPLILRLSLSPLSHTSQGSFLVYSVRFSKYDIMSSANRNIFTSLPTPVPFLSLSLSLSSSTVTSASSAVAHARQEWAPSSGS